MDAQTVTETQVNPYDLDEQFVAEGQGRCLTCSCEQWVPARPKERDDGGPYVCGPCGHDRAVHKRNPAGAQAKP